MKNQLINRPRTSKDDERGMAAIMITMVIMAVIALIVLGFASISRREQRQSLDNQLQLQAFYAAESGVNDAMSIINGNSGAAGASLSKLTCDTAAGGLYAALTAKSDLAEGVSYTCVLVDTTPASLRKDGVTDVNTWVAPLITEGTKPANLQITWNPSSDYAGNFPRSDCKAATVNDNLSPATGANSWTCKYPLLRVDLVDTSVISNDSGTTINGSAGQSAKVMNDRLQSYYFYPTTKNGSSVPSFVPSSTAQAPTPVVTLVDCDNASNSYASCQVNIPGNFSNNMAMRVSSIYGSSTVTVKALDSSGSSLPFIDAQMIIDVTGKAQNVLRRIRVNVPIQSSAGIPSPLISAGAICKRYETRPGDFKIASDISLSDPGNPLCP